VSERVLKWGEERGGRLLIRWTACCVEKGSHRNEGKVQIRGPLHEYPQEERAPQCGLKWRRGQELILI